MSELANQQQYDPKPLEEQSAAQSQGQTGTYPWKNPQKQNKGSRTPDKKEGDDGVSEMSHDKQ